MGIECCKDCQNRHIGCHGSCTEYIAQAQAAREERERRWKAKKGENGADAVPPPFAEALVRANLPEWCGEKITTMEELERKVAV